MGLSTEELYDQLKVDYPDWDKWNLESAKAAGVTVSAPSSEEIKKLIDKQGELFQNVKTEIKGLAQKQKKIESIIYEIKAALLRANVTLDSGEKLADLFNVFVVRYRDIIKGSKEEASKLSSYARSWVQVILPTIINPDASLEDIKAVFKISLEEAKQRKSESDALTTTMNTFVNDLRDFNNTFQDWAQKKSQELNKEIQKIQDEIVKLQAELADVRTVLGVGGTALAVGVSVGLWTTGALLATNPITLPFAIVMFIFGGLAFLGGLSALIWAGVRSNALSSEIQQKENDKQRLSQQLADIQQAQSALASLPSLISDFVDQFSSFEAVWSGISQMIQNIIDDLNKGIESDSITQIRAIATDIGEQWTDISYLMDLYVANLL